MRWSWEVRPHGILRLMSLLVSWLGRRQEQEIWGNLKRFRNVVAEKRRPNSE